MVLSTLRCSKPNKLKGFMPIMELHGMRRDIQKWKRLQEVKASISKQDDEEDADQDQDHYQGWAKSKGLRSLDASGLISLERLAAFTCRIKEQLNMSSPVIATLMFAGSGVPSGVQTEALGPGVGILMLGKRSGG
ncbi:hypothetical protein AK812_SmicGene11859 [Symbiodinium microadriaticum]|uniref:Uncharacterized protein n=1 Tax=Symbiodinium microadriaticum TaxID=2951 RepID=A0A1Q9EC59_SYMMI|nr:hypothetical protein AK812_SmicGene11859 [Symbiodinium microadriaticum]